MPLLSCPNCDKGMQEINRNNVQIDMCPSCRGVWLDRGELEKLLAAVNTVRQSDRDYDDKPRYDSKPSYDSKPHHASQTPYGNEDYAKKKKKSDFLDIFDIF